MVSARANRARAGPLVVWHADPLISLRLGTVSAGYVVAFFSLRVLGAKVGRKLCVKLHLEIPRYFIK